MQVLRFAGNIILAKLLAPSAFGLVGVVNLTILGINMLSDLGLRQVIIQRQSVLSQDFLNTVWVLQIARGFAIWLIALLASILLIFGQTQGLIVGNVYADPLLPFLIVGAASSAIFQGFESTNSITERRELNLGKVMAMSIGAQLVALVTMISIAHWTRSPWALIVGAIVTAGVQCIVSHSILPGVKNKWHFDMSLAKDILKKSRWILVSSPLTFLQSNIEVIVLGGLVNATLLGNYMIAYLLTNVMHQVSSNLAGNVFFPGLSTAVRDSPSSLAKTYTKFQLVSDAIILTGAGSLMAAGSTIVDLLFDHRYASAGQLLSYLALGLVGLRYHVIEALMQAQGNFKLTTAIDTIRLLCLTAATYIGYQIGGLSGAAIGVGLSWFSGWPILIWYRQKMLPYGWKMEFMAPVLLGIGYGLGIMFTYFINFFR